MYVNLVVRLTCVNIWLKVAVEPARPHVVPSSLKRQRNVSGSWSSAWIALFGRHTASPAAVMLRTRFASAVNSASPRSEVRHGGQERQLVQIIPAKIVTRSLEIAQLAGEELDDARFV